MNFFSWKKILWTTRKQCNNFNIYFIFPRDNPCEKYTHTNTICREYEVRVSRCRCCYCCLQKHLKHQECKVAGNVNKIYTYNMLNTFSKLLLFRIFTHSFVSFDALRFGWTDTMCLHIYTIPWEWNYEVHRICSVWSLTETTFRWQSFVLFVCSEWESFLAFYSTSIWYMAQMRS